MCEQNELECVQSFVATYADLAEPVNYHAASNVLIQWHLPQENTE